MIYIKNMQNINEIVKKRKLLSKFILIYKYIFNIVTIRNFGDKKIYILPWKEEKNKEIKDKRYCNICKKIKLINSQEKIIVISNSLSKDERIISSLYKNKLRVIDGRWLYNVLLEDIVKYIAKCKNKNIKDQAVSILINKPNNIDMNNIINLAREIKNLKIVTNNSKYFKRIEKSLYEEQGIPILIVNNKKRSLQSSDIIINIDFSEKEINNYNINRRGIIININNYIQIESKSFNGININWYKIKLNDEYIDLFREYDLTNQFDVDILYESVIYSNDKLEKIKKRIEKDKIKIEYLIGVKGKINDTEYL